jgi:hypothetical protein
VTALAMDVIGSQVTPYAASPELTLRLRITESSGVRVYAIVLRAQVMIAAQRRRYDAAEGERLIELFGSPARYGDTLRPLLWMHVSQAVPAFSGATEVDLHLPCSYDFEIAAHKYLAALGDGTIPLELLFSGTVLSERDGTVSAGFVPWSCEARYALPVAVWKATMDAYFPNSAWLRIRRDAFDELHRYKTAMGLPTWEAAIERLCASAKAQR